MTAVVDASAGSGHHSASTTTSRARDQASLGRILLAAAFVCWLVSLRSLAHASVSQYGLLATASPFFVISIALTALGFVFVVRSSDVIGGWAAVGLSICTLRLSITLATSAPFYSWTYKHIAVADYIKQTGSAARDVDIYQHWNGLFAATAWLSDISGISTLTIAHWFTPAVYVVAAVVVYGLARAWRCTPMVAVIVVFLTQSLDWVGQSYYSPQCISYLLALGIIGLLGLAVNSSGRASTSVMLLILVPFCAITVTHQLTPYWLIGLTFLLIVTRRLRPWWLVVVMVVIAVGFLAYNYSAAAHFGLLSGGNPISNAQRNVPLPRVGGWLFTSQVERILSGTMWGGALICAVVAAVRRRPFLLPTLVAFSSFGILFGQSYGGEAIFRVFLYSLPGCALLLAPALERLIKSRITAVPMAVLVTVAIVASAQGLFGIWSANLMPKNEVKLSQSLLQTNPIPTYITAVAPVWPERNSDRYVDFARWNPDYDATLVNAADLVGTHFNTAASYNKLMSTLIQNHGDTPTLLVITQQMRVYDWYYGILPWDALPNLLKRMAKDPRWQPYSISKTVRIYKFVNP